MIMNKIDQTQFIKQIAGDLGFDYCGIARAEPLDMDARRLERWLNKGMQGSMQYMENHFELRVNPEKLVPGAKSVITLLLNYFPAEQQKNRLPKISKYAFGRDYHEVIRKKLRILLEQIRSKLGDVQGRGFVDSAPVLERSWAVKSGLGWVGKNGNLINKNSGSFLFIATLIIDLELACDDPICKRLLWNLPAMHRRLSNRCHPGRQGSGRKQMHFLFYHRIERCFDSGKDERKV